MAALFIPRSRSNCMTAVPAALARRQQLGYLASSLRAAGHSAEIAAFNEWSDAAHVMERAKTADAVGLSMSFQVRAPEFLTLAAALRKERPSLPIVAGGHFATCAAVELMRDYPSRPPPRAPRHALAVLIAAGIVGCG